MPAIASLNMKLRDLIPFLIGFLVLAALLYTLNPGKVFALIAKANLLYFAAALVMYFASDALAAITLRLLFGTGDIAFLLPCHMCGMLYASLTPGRVGYYYVAFSLSKKLGRSVSSNAGVLTLMQAINFLLKVIFSITAVIYFSLYFISVEAKYYLVLVSLAPIAFIVVIGLFLYTSIPLKIIGNRPGIFAKARSFIKSMQDASRSVGVKVILKVMCLSFFSWLSLGVMMWMITKSLGLNVTYLSCLMMHPLLSAVMFIPIVPAGLGLTETGSALIFRLIGLTTADGVAFMLMYRAATLIVDAFGLVDMWLVGKSK
jgi:uncharacterized protein (TIRG00374 family)